ncbi:tigger transposable element-derived protein 1-like [Macrobrachium rosenbergii]|uniref:tigger transposable element-derived protein 1-like n=1 Tax=Macrobrachium rosenbergii TaxID=79674 RepID=UPI0034D5FFFC
MEKLLLIWLEDQNQRRVPVSLSVIQEKARELHAAVVKKSGEGSASEEFSASRGWFNSFKARANLHNVKLQGEAVSADGVAAESFPSGLAEIIREGGYTADQGLPFKVLLVLDNAPGHPADLSNMHPNVKVVYLPPNTTSLIQSMDQGVIANFKAYYLRRTIRSALRAVEGNKELTLKEFWKGCNIADAVTNIAHAWDEIKVTTLNGAWKKLCPVCE